VEAHGFGILNREVTEAADAGDDHPLAGAGIGGLETLVHGDARADDGCDIEEADVLGEMRYVVWIGYGVVRVTAVLGVATELGFGAAGLLTR